MKDLIQSLGIDPLIAGIAAGIIASLVVFTLILTIAALTTWAERRIFSRMQYRIGPNRVGPQGILQWLADGIKMILKEDLIPDGADRIMFRIAPYFCIIGVFGTMAVVPWGTLVPVDLNVGIFYLMSITSLVIIGTLMAGWSSNNKWSLLGGMRAAAQIVSYEVPVAMGLLPPILMAGTLSISGLMAAQGWAPWDWNLLNNPFTVLSFFVFFTGLMAEANRAPFDMPEADSELVSGFCTEYSGFRYGIFYLSEYMNLFVLGSVVTAVYLGGGNLPGFLAGNTILSVLVFEAKVLVIMFVVIWVRWTLPRFRVDQMMKLSWKYLLPGAFIAFFGQAIYMLITWDHPMIVKGISVVMFLAFLGVLFKLVQRIVSNAKELAIPAN
ncbi:MAG: NADH-quinone oxidoreductase subunit NuoH [Proteobacteria bacterium]|nr:NADH-quinone oxidoreductase subunit NuoH [Pseudomonadota bacterium]